MFAATLASCFESLVSSSAASTEVRQVMPFKSQVLYQLSYAGAPVIVFAESFSACRRSHGRPSALLSNCCQNCCRSQGFEREQIALFPDLVRNADLPLG